MRPPRRRRRFEHRRRAPPPPDTQPRQLSRRPSVSVERCTTSWHSTPAPPACARSRSTTGRVGRSRYREFPQHFPRPGWVEHDADEIWTTTVADAAELVAELRDAAGRGDRHHQPARDRRRLGPPHRPAAAPRDRVAGPAHRGALRRAARRRAPRAAGPPSAPAACSTRTSRPRSSTWLLHDGGVDVDADLAFGTDRHVAAVEPDRRRACTSPTPSNASRTMLFDIGALATGPTSCATCSACPPRACPRCARRAAVRRHRAPRGLPAGIPVVAASPATSRPRCSARRASSRA